MIFFHLVSFFYLSLFASFVISQELDSDDILDRINRIEKNINDLQKFNLNDDSSNLSSGYISRNEKRLDEIETATQNNFGKFEILENRINEIEKKIELLNIDISTQLDEIKKIFQNKLSLSDPIRGSKTSNFVESESEINNELQQENMINVEEAKKKYENAIKLLWADKLDEAMAELLDLKSMKPQDLMPNIQYWLGEVFYEKKDFSRAILEFGEGLENYPNSIKGPDNMLKLGLSFANLKKKVEACNVFFELEVKYPSASKDVLQRALSEKEKLDCIQE